MHSLQANRAIPRSLEPALLRRSLRLGRRTLESSRSPRGIPCERRCELGARGIVEDGARGAEESRHCGFGSVALATLLCV